MLRLAPAPPPRRRGAVVHSFAGIRAKSSRGDWIIEPSATDPAVIHAAGVGGSTRPFLPSRRRAFNGIAKGHNATVAKNRQMKAVLMHAHVAEGTR